jgi:hypothetical protein
MTEAEIAGLLDAHDGLVAACLDSRLSFIEFLAAYGDFPGGYGLDEDKAATDTRAILPLFRKRIAFHRQVAGVLSGFHQPLENVMLDNAEEFLQRAVLVRLRQLVSRYPDFKAEPPAVRDLQVER